MHYSAEGTTQLTPGQAKVVAFVKANYVIPDDFELDKLRYGPLSGVSFEERLLAAYRWGKLGLKRGARVGAPPQCSACGGEGHWPTECTVEDK